MFHRDSTLLQEDLVEVWSVLLLVSFVTTATKSLGSDYQSWHSEYRQDWEERIWVQAEPCMVLCGDGAGRPGRSAGSE